MTRRIVFLPGISGHGDFWRPVGERLPASVEKVYLDYPGAGSIPARDDVRSFDDLLRIALDAIGERPCALVAQSMGGWLALRATLARPSVIARLVLSVTSAGVDMAAAGAVDWRPAYRESFPQAAEWIFELPRLLPEAAVRSIAAPTLLLWADRDPISPLSVGRTLHGLLPDARLETIDHDDHMIARERPDWAAPLVARHLGLS